MAYTYRPMATNHIKIYIYWESRRGGKARGNKGL